MRSTFLRKRLRDVGLLLATMGLLYACGSTNDRGELTGTKKARRWYIERPLGMVLVPEGSVTVTTTDPLGNGKPQTKTMSVSSFYMDETEITNQEYKQFVNWVKDSIVRTRLAEQVEIAKLLADGNQPRRSKRGIYRYEYVQNKAKKKRRLSVYDQYMNDNYYFLDEIEETSTKLNWNVPIVWDTQRYPDVDYVEVMDSLYLRKEETPDGVRKFDISHLNYTYTKLDANKKLITEVVNVYPDTTVWKKDFKNSFNDPMLENYFSHPAYSQYPVVGISWKQAEAFCSWRTFYKNSFLVKKMKSNQFKVPPFRLPTEAEWEYAAKGNKGAEIKYSWGTNELTTEEGCFLANFKPMEGNYTADKGLYTVDAKNYMANEFGLYNMSGNVAEWTNTSYNLTNSVITSSINPHIKDNDQKKITKGGSWKDIIYALEIGSRDYEYKDSARSYIGFRTVQSFTKK